MKRINIVFLFVSLFVFCFHSCNNEEYNAENNNQKGRYISEEEKNALLEGVSDTIFKIETDDDFFDLRNSISSSQEQELLSLGYIKIEEDENILKTRASVQKYTIKVSPLECLTIGPTFKAKFSQKFCDQINVDTDPDLKVYPGKTYLCNWENAGSFIELKPNESGGVLPSPKAALKPSTKGSFASGNAERGYDAYKIGNKYQFASHMLKVVCEDKKGPTYVIAGCYPYWDSKTGIYEINFAILSR